MRENMPGLTLNVRLRVKPDDSSTTYEISTKHVEWNPEKVAVIICDMWETHHCISTAERVGEMAPRMNEVIAGMRKSGSLIIHSPWSCMEFYDNTPQRRRAQDAPHVNVGVEFGGFHWNQAREIGQLEEFPLPIGITDPGPCSCHTSDPCCKKVFHTMIRQIETIEIASEDAISDQGQEVYNLLQQRGIEHIVIMGIAVNVCVLEETPETGSLWM